jgi:hypothetical protein
MNETEFNQQIEDSEINTDNNFTDDLEELIEQLPESFPQALATIQEEIAPIIAGCDAGLKDHYISLIKKRTKAASKRAVQLEIESAINLETEDGIICESER